jgi:glycosyltransferase involved in cell wall biosynthesis
MTGSPWGGSEELWSQAALCLAKKGHSIDASVHHWPRRAAALDHLQAAGIHVHARKQHGIFRPFLKRLGLNGEQLLAKRWLGRVRPDFALVSSGSMVDAPWWLEAIQALGIPNAVIVHTVGEGQWPRDDECLQLRNNYQRAAAVFFVSRGNWNLAERMLGYDMANAKIVRNPYNVNYHVQCPFPAQAEPFRIACVARLDLVAKGQDLLLELFRMDKWRSRNLRLSLYGDGSNRESLRAQAQRYGLEAISFCGYCDSVEEIWRRHQLLVLPSRFEGLPLALVEAMLCARPVVVTDVAGNAELVDDNETGFVAAAPTVAALDEALERAWQRRADWRAMGLEAARRIRKQIPANPAELFADEIECLLKTRP